LIVTFAPHPPSARPWKLLFQWRARIALFVLLALIFAGVAAFRGAGRWLVRPDALQRADAIVVLSGSMPYRAEEAANFFRMGYAPAIWLTRPQSPAAVLQSMGIAYAGEEDYNRQILLHSGVPASAIQVLPGAIEDTEEELTDVIHQMNQEGETRVIIVTSPEHTRRVRALWRLLAPPKLKLIVCAATQDPYDADHWWENTRDAYSVVREYLGLLNAWLHLPVRPRSR
jgi:uncharacterized SAM-binding protein YcdF (DUF218 family)